MPDSSGACPYKTLLLRKQDIAQQLADSVPRNSIDSTFAMTRNEAFSFREPRPSAAGEQEPHDPEQDAIDLDQVDSRLMESKTKRTCVLVASAMLQLPIWGALSPVS